MLSALLLIGLQGQSLRLPDLAAYDMKTVDRVVLGQTADKDLKKLYKVGKGAMRPEGLVISNDEQWRVDALLNGRGGDAKAIAVWYEAKRAVEFSDFTRDLGPAERSFVRNRSSDWSVNAWPERGIAMFVTRDGNRDYVEGILLTDKDRILTMTRALEAQPTEILDLQAIFDRKDRRVFIRSFDVDISSKNINIGDQRREERFIQSFAERRWETRDILFGRDGGTISISINIDFEKTNVSVSLSGKNEVGPVSGSGSSTARKFRVERDVAQYRREYVEDAVLDALTDAVRAAERAIAGQKPPTPADDRRLGIYGVINGSIR